MGALGVAMGCLCSSQEVTECGFREVSPLWGRASPALQNQIPDMVCRRRASPFSLCMQRYILPATDVGMEIRAGFINCILIYSCQWCCKCGLSIKIVSTGKIRWKWAGAVYSNKDRLYNPLEKATLKSRLSWVTLFSPIGRSLPRLAWGPSLSWLPSLS